MLRYGLFIFLMAFSSLSLAKIIEIHDTDSFVYHLKHAHSGDQLQLKPGLYQGQFEISNTVSIFSLDKVIIDALGKGSAFTISSPDVTITGLTIQNWGADHYESDAGILGLKGADRLHISNNTLIGDGFGIYARNVNEIQITSNVIKGNPELFILDRGDGIHLRHVNSASINDNVISQVRDGIYLESTESSKIFGNRFFDQQYGIHYMYSKFDEAANNQSYRVDGGYALMNSEQIHLHHNKVWAALDFGILLNMTKNSLVESNKVEQIINPAEEVLPGKEGKGIFIYGARDNTVRGNRFSHSDIGFYMAMGGEGNQVYENLFIDNFSQVKYVGNKRLEWSKDGKGNYWSGYLGWDHNLDGIGNTPYRPNDNIDKLFWLYPEASFLMDSPIVAVLRWADKQFELGDESGIIDSYPLLQ
ncbi:nitrous oxide reductase family maturation protein NosD [Shewanella eurypsychrophilus]|uniref:Nitrous oxide reductase family maturation protein NosD n=1 Tax=Shewanella eurypsychrophilus TaxID=2593656 RepID=A0ABX6VB26_9GAMM|nr:MULTISPECIES: nitrous oxide reductase family maturation protein NosD [Shewanella]QFU24684.1 nitrous oxide reductase family maturation protein NosD [Shewanella sp. YLB-09]QPG59876.1 nitrous oxide reductase family maturation protein NosD [Shewanella eurypsychrophilus]